MTPKSRRLYITLHSLALVACWVWFGALWAVAFFLFSMGDIEWWLLIASACAGLYGLRPNLEKAIDASWLRGIKNPNEIADRIAELRPIKRRINMIFSVVVLVVLVLITVLYFTRVIWVGGEAGS